MPQKEVEQQEIYRSGPDSGRHLYGADTVKNVLPGVTGLCYKYNLCPGRKQWCDSLRKQHENFMEKADYAHQHLLLLYQILHHMI